MAKIGADIGQLAILKQTFDRESQTVLELTRTIDGQLGNTWWIGPAHDRFAADWNSSFKPNLQRLQEALTSAGAEVERRRTALEQAGS